MTKAAFIAAVPSLAAMSGPAADQTLTGWLTSGRLVATYDDAGEIRDIDSQYVGRELRRVRNNTAKAAGLTR